MTSEVIPLVKTKSTDTSNKRRRRGGRKKLSKVCRWMVVPTCIIQKRMWPNELLLSHSNLLMFLVYIHIYVAAAAIKTTTELQVWPCGRGQLSLGVPFPPGPRRRPPTGSLPPRRAASHCGVLLEVQHARQHRLSNICQSDK